MTYQDRLRRLERAVTATAGGSIRISKGTTSNLFRYQGRQGSADTVISLADFNHVISVCDRTWTLEVEGLATYEQIVEATLPHGLLPTVTPELKHITIGGATVGIGIESSCHRYGFVHDGLIEADVLLPGGQVVTCTADNEHADLFQALPNSYGSLGYILRARVELMAARPYVHVRHQRYRDVRSYLEAMRTAVETAEADFLEGLFHGRDELYLTRANFVDDAEDADDVYRMIYHRTVRERPDLVLPTRHYLFRYDPDWFWNVPETPVYNLLRRIAPRRLRSSKFYNRYSAWKHGLLKALKIPPDRHLEPLIQDWQLPWEESEAMVHFVLDHVDLNGQPWVALPVVPRRSPTLYPVKAGDLYFNLGCYCLTRKPRDDQDYYYTRLVDEECFRRGGLKMLYSSTFLDRQRFDQLYNGAEYAGLKQRFDPDGAAPTLFDKAVGGR